MISMVKQNMILSCQPTNWRILSSFLSSSIENKFTRRSSPVVRFFSTTSHLQKEITDDKAFRAAKMKKLHRENKELFGEIIETKAGVVKKENKKRQYSLQNQSLDSDRQYAKADVKKLKKKVLRKSTSNLAERNSLTDKNSSLEVDRLVTEEYKDGEVNWMSNEFSNASSEVLTSVNQLNSSFDIADPTKEMAKQIVPPLKLQQSENSMFKSIRSEFIFDSVSGTLKKVTKTKESNISTDLFNQKSSHDVQIGSVHSVANFDKNLNDTIHTMPSSISHVDDINFPILNPDRLHLDDIPFESGIITIPFPRINYLLSDSPLENEQRSDIGRRLPSVSKILKETMPKEQADALEKWEKKMILQLGEAGFRRYKEDMLNNGKELHKNIQRLLSGTPVEDLSISKPISGHWSSLHGILSQIEQVHVLESHVSHPHLNYCGIVDCIAVYGNKLVVIDWKTSQKPKPFVSLTYDTPLQIAAYIGAINYDANYMLKITEGCIVIAYEDGHQAQTFCLNPFELSKYWRLWLQRLHQFQNLSQQSSS